MSDWLSSGPWLLVGAGDLSASGTVTLDRDESRHLKSSLRRRPGDVVVLTDGAGAVARAEVRFASSSGAEVAIVELRQLTRGPEKGVTVALGVLHTRAMDWAVQKAVETGASMLTPLMTERCQLDRRASEARQGHWQRVALQACKQCHRAWSMGVTDVRTLDELLQDRQAAPGAVAHSEGVTPDGLPQEQLSTLVVGPEGGFTLRERTLLDEAGWPRLRLGEHVLRAETAVTVGTAVVVNRNAFMARDEENHP